MASTSIALGSLSGVATASEQNETESSSPEFTTVPVTETDRNQFIAKALRSQDVRDIKKRLVKKGYQPRIAESLVREIQGNSEDPSPVSVLIPFETGDPSTAAFISWISGGVGGAGTIAHSTDKKVGKITPDEFGEKVSPSFFEGIDSLELIAPDAHYLSLTEAGVVESEYDYDEPVMVNLETGDVVTSDVQASASVDCVTQCAGTATGALCVLGCGSCLRTPIVLTCLGCVACSLTGACCLGRCSDPNGALCLYARIWAYVPGQSAALYLWRGCQRKNCAV